MPITDSNKTGQQAEESAYHYLKTQGLVLVERNYNSPRGEIDLIMQDNNTTVFIEVRYRSNNWFGSGAESVDQHKQQKLLATAVHYLQKKPEGSQGYVSI